MSEATAPPAVGYEIPQAHPDYPAGEAPCVVPSRARAGHLPVLGAVAYCTLCVAESEYDAYAAAHPGVPIVTHPDSVVGLTAKRQWIYDRWGDVVQVDDDLEGIWPLSDPVRALDPVAAWELIQSTAYTARQLGAYLYGFAPQATPTAYNSLRPFRLSGRIRGTLIGLRAGSKLHWPCNVDLVEDTFIALFNAYHHRYLFLDCRFATKQARTMCTRGGAANMRTVQAHFDGAAKLARMFGKQVVRPRAKNVQLGAAHPAQIQIHLPF